ncbi:hypothetical protein [Nitrosomonas sp. Nm166]|uniref:hypothetical protein n=1 Tax=Nitrosomonas sp. Nm166 TaxID=1881054 RepID=UPI0008E46905|nr:hypothetical protein [Nitrosomonas sp. Nm166]SFD86160.1 hypothetical protein SAMN05428977_100191 [Nitrosomonas sp. Nm166]
MSEQNKPADKSSQTTPAIAVVALLISLFAAQEIIFKPTRPAMIHTERMSTEDVRSRLWQDPFQAVELYKKQDSVSGKTFHIRSTKENHTQSQPGIFEGLISDTTFNIENKLNRLTCHNEEPPETAAHSITELKCQIYKETEKQNSVHILAVMVPGGPYAEYHEWRLRSRYALISGLHAAGYMPIDPEHIGFVDFRNACQKDKKNSYCDFPDYMPYEWFELNDQLKPISIEELSDKELELLLKNKKEKVLILWLNNDTFAHSSINSLEVLGQLKKEIISNSKIESEISFNIIGPHDSGTLRKMYADMNRIKKESLPDNYLNHSHIFATSVTANDERLIGKTLYQDRGNWLNDKIIRTISPQDKLAHALLCELALRGVTPYRADPNKSISRNCPDLAGAIPARQSNQPHHMVLIGELDTFYSQTLTATILKKIAEFGENQNHQNNNGISEGHIHTFNYLRGLDGITSEHTATSQDSKGKESQANKLNDKEFKKQLERPTETSQLDYLVRLAEQIKHLDKIKASEGGIQAIGITGSDPYDKLLILQALRPKFPEALFFTTDLDARFFHSSEIKWTRNLIVASPFGLQLNDEWQKNTPPFRDNYQTALYFTTLLALHCPHTEGQCSVSTLKEFLKKLQEQPRLFEIGNNNAVDLSHTAGNGIHPEPELASVIKLSDWEKILKISGPLLAIAFLAILLYYSLIQERFKPIIVGVFISITLLLIFYHTVPSLDDSGSEPFASGTSIWPAIGIRFVAAILAGYLLYSIYQQLKENKEAIEKEYISPASVGEDTKKTKSLWAKLNIDRWKMNSKEPIPFKDFWSDYLESRTISCCSVRAILMVILYVGFVVLLIQSGFFDIPKIPFRGEVSSNIHTAILILSIFSYLMLIFIIVDVAHLCSHLIRLLKEHNVKWPANLVNINKSKYSLPQEAVEHKILLDFIHRHTIIINKFIYYPFFILFLVILSRAYYFDNWQITPLLLFVFGFTALIALSSAIRLRIAAQDARKDILQKLDSYSSQLLENRAWYEKGGSSAKLKLLIGEIRDFKEGVFQPLSHHPIVLSVLIPLSSIVGVYLLEYLALFAF